MRELARPRHVSDAPGKRFKHLWSNTINHAAAHKYNAIHTTMSISLPPPEAGYAHPVLLNNDVNSPVPSK